MTAGDVYTTYNSLGSVISKRFAGFLYDGSELIAEYNSVGSVLRKYVHSTRDDDPQVWLEGAGNSDIRHVFANYQGSVVATTNAAGSAVQIFKYGPYGEPKDAANNPAWNGFRFRYTGQQIIPEAKLYYYKARVYDPNLGTFLQTDPIGTKDDLNLYAYVKGDPVNHIDPDGTIAIDSVKEDAIKNSVKEEAIKKGPPKEIPGGPYQPTGEGQKPGNFQGPKQPSGQRHNVQYVPPENEGGPTGSKGYWKYTAPGQDPQRYNSGGKPITAEEAHPGNGQKPQPKPPSNNPKVPPTPIGSITKTTGIAGLIIWLFWAKPAN